MCVLLSRGKAQGLLNDQVSPNLSLLPAKRKKHELPAYLGLSHALHSLKQTTLAYLSSTDTHTHTKRHTRTQSLGHTYTCYEKHRL